MRRSAVALLIILTAIIGYFSMVGVAILIRGVPEDNFQEPQDYIELAPDGTSSVHPTIDQNETAEPVTADTQK